jgi:hypothetical protein
MRDQYGSNISRAPFLEFITGKTFGQCPFAGTRAIIGTVVISCVTTRVAAF